MKIETISLLISCASFILAALALGWNIYRDVVHRAALKVTMMWGVITLGPDRENWPRRLVVTVTNFGPGKNKPGLLTLRKTSLWLRIRRKSVMAILNADYDDPLNPKKPSELDVGERVDFTFRPEANLFLRTHEFDQIGITDPFGKTHWCSRKHYRRVQKNFLDDMQHNNSNATS